MESGLEYILVRQVPFASEHGSLLQIQGDVTTPTREASVPYVTHAHAYQQANYHRPSRHLEFHKSPPHRNINAG
jgi:hypothetical protein